METCFQRSEQFLDVARLRRRWAALRSLPRGSSRDLMTHGDLTPGNVLVADGRLVGVLDVGRLGPADPALDLVGAWHRPGVGLRAGDGGGLVLPREQPGEKVERQHERVVVRQAGESPPGSR